MSGALCQNIFKLSYSEVSIHLKYYQPYSILKIVIKVVKSGCFDKILQWRAPIFLRNEGGISSLLYKNIDVLLSY